MSTVRTRQARRKPISSLTAAVRRALTRAVERGQLGPGREDEWRAFSPRSH